jgi:hypothetical protein
VDRQATLKDQLEKLAVLYSQSGLSSGLSQWLDHIRSLRSRRIVETYFDLRQQDRYRAAVDFLANDLFGRTGLHRLGQQFQKAAPTMVRVLPDYLLDMAIKAFEFTVLTMQLDLNLARHVQSSAVVLPGFNIDALHASMRSLRQRVEYARQLTLVLELGAEIETIVHRPFVAAALKLCRTPARLLGLAELQSFLERGIAAFIHMRGSAEFFRTFGDREKTLINQIFDTNSTD